MVLYFRVMIRMAQKPKLGPDAFLIGFIFIFMLLLMFFSGCKHAPVVEPATISQNTGNGNGNGNGNGGTDGGSTCSPDTTYFQSEVLPLIISNCTNDGCHNPADHAADLVLNNYQNIMSFGEVRPGRPDNSKLYEVLITSDPDDRMPPSGRTPLTSNQINTIYTWISQGALNNVCQNTCDTTNMSFSINILPIMQLYCNGCHSGTSPSGNISLTTHAAVLTQVNNGKLLGSIKHLSGYSAMPKGSSQLSACLVNKITAWVNAGSPNN